MLLTKPGAAHERKTRLGASQLPPDLKQPNTTDGRLPLLPRFREKETGRRIDATPRQAKSSQRGFLTARTQTMQNIP